MGTELSSSKPSSIRNEVLRANRVMKLKKSRQYHAKQVVKFKSEDAPVASLEWLEGMTAYHERRIGEIDAELDRLEN